MKKTLKKVLIWLISIVGFAVLVAWITGNGYLIKGISCTYLRGYSTANIYDKDYFYTREVKPGAKEPWKESSSIGSNTLTPEEEKLHEDYESVAYVVIKDDQVIFEKYWGEHDDIAVSNSFSMAKSITALLIGAALDEGLIKNLDDLAYKYIPKLGEMAEVNKKITIKDLLTMTSTIDFDESYGNPFGFMARATYGSDLESVTYDGFSAQKEPGSEWEYLGGNTILLAFIVEKVTGKTLSDYFSEKIWSKVGAEHPAQWALDQENGHEKSYCCFNATARDFARLGKLILNNGQWNGKQIISARYITEMTTPISAPSHAGDGPADHYGYQIWLDEENGEKMVNYRGMLGQYICVFPESNMVMVRLGHKRDATDGHCPGDLKHWIGMAKRLGK